MTSFTWTEYIYVLMVSLSKDDTSNIYLSHVFYNWPLYKKTPSYVKKAFVSFDISLCIYRSLNRYIFKLTDKYEMKAIELLS